jgi:uncharacterized damage-inducible protein DinB
VPVGDRIFLGAMAEPALPSALSRGPDPSFPQLVVWYLREYQEKIQRALALVTFEELWWRPAPPVNSLGNLVLHLSGNLSLWVLAGLGGQHYSRHRAAEFAADRSHDREALLRRLDEVVTACVAVVSGLDEEGLDRPVAIQGYSTNVRGALFHAVEHMSYHTGQALQLVKQLPAGAGLELYPQHREE